MGIIWAPWRAKYLSKTGEINNKECVFCALSNSTPTKENLLVYQAQNSFVVMNKYPYNNGHILIVPKKHASSLDQLSKEEYSEISELLRVSIEVVKKVYEPHGCNIGMNLGRAAGAGIADHLHYHIVPRWNGDTNFMPVFSDVKIISENIFESYDRLRDMFVEVMI